VRTGNQPCLSGSMRDAHKGSWTQMGDTQLCRWWLHHLLHNPQKLGSSSLRNRGWKTPTHRPNPADNHLFLCYPGSKNGFYNLKWLHFKWLHKHLHSTLNFAS
jgi:hypothetical protein